MTESPCDCTETDMQGYSGSFQSSNDEIISKIQFTTMPDAVIIVLLSILTIVYNMLNNTIALWGVWIDSGVRDAKISN